jgi:hypothetical protein
MVDSETPERVHRGSRAVVGRDAPATANAVTTKKSFITAAITQEICPSQYMYM